MAEESNVPPTSVASTDPALEAPSDPQSTDSKPDSTPAMSGALQESEAEEVPKALDAAPVVDTNGEVERSAEAAPPPVGETSLEHVTIVEDTEMKDAGSSAAPAPASDTITSEAKPEDSPSVPKKSSNGKRKSAGGVPEHKKTKLSKKKSMPRITHLDAQPGEYYFARLKSYPPWPSVICDEEMLPTSLLTTRPVTTKQLDGTYKEPYADGGKRAHERTFPIMFLHTNEFAWIPNTDLSDLNPEECKEVSEKGKSKSLIQAYGVAAESHGLQHFKEMLQDHQRALQADLEEREEREAAKAAKAEKKKRKSEVAADDDVDMDDVEDGEEAPKPKSSKKRKKEEDSEGETEKPVKTPKTSTKLKINAPKSPAATESAKKTKEPKEKKAKTPRKAAPKDSPSEQEEDAETPKEPERPLDPAEAKQKKEKEVLYLRHKLQKGFLTRDQAPKEEEMAAMANYITKLEGYGDLEVSIIRTTKINKVLKAIIKLNSIPKDEEHKFRDRSAELLGKWTKILGAEPDTKEEEPHTNGANGVANAHASEGEEAKGDNVEAQITTEAEVEENTEKMGEDAPTDLKTDIDEKGAEPEAAPVAEPEIAPVAAPDAAGESVETTA